MKNTSTTTRGSDLDLSYGQQARNYATSAGFPDSPLGLEAFSISVFNRKVQQEQLRNHPDRKQLVALLKATGTYQR